MPNKTPMSRFHIHDDLTAPEASLPILKGLQSSAGQLPNFLGVLAGSAAALRGYVRFRGELRRGTLPAATRERIGLAVAGSLRSAPGIAQHARTARAAGLGLDEITAARQFASADPKEASLLTFLEALQATGGRPAQHLVEEAREHDWTDEQLLEAVSHVALNEFQSLIANAAALPHDQADAAVLPAAA